MLFLSTPHGHGYYRVADGNHPDDRALGIRATVGFQLVSEPSYYWDGRRRGVTEPQFIMQWTTAGTGELEIRAPRRRRYALPAGRAFLVEIPGDHVYRLPTGTPSWEFAYINVAGETARSLWREALRRLGPVADFPENSAPIEIMRRLYLLRENVKPRAAWLTDPTEAAASVLDFLLSLLRYAVHPISLDELADDDGVLAAGEGNRRGNSFKTRRPSPSAAVLRAAAYARTHFSEGAGVEEMATAAGLSRHHFTRLFHRQFGLPPLEYLTRLRLRRAVQLILENNLNLGGVARAVGFTDGKYLGKLFRRRTGMTPSEFRARCAALPELAHRLV